MGIPKSGTYALLGDGKVKIGKSSDIVKRIRGIQLQSPSPLRLVGTLPVDIETELHREMLDHHLHGEWFESEPIMARLRQLLDPQDVDVMSLVTGNNKVGRPNSMKTHCLRGHELTKENCIPEEWDKGHRICLSCKAIQGREYRARNRDRLKEYRRKRLDENRDQKKEWNKRSRDHVREYNRDYREKNRKRLIENSRGQYAQNKEKMKKYFAKWREENRESVRRSRSEWAKRNRDRLNAYKRERYAQRRTPERTKTEP